MISSRNIEDLHPKIQDRARAHVAACKAEGIDLLITCTYRDGEAQDALFAQGRTRPGTKVTNSKAGQSMHNYRLAYDVVPLRNGKPVWNTTGEDWPLWAKVGALGEREGLEWAGNWHTFREYPHFQFTGSMPISYFEGGGVL